MDRMIVFTFTNKENGIVFEEYPTIRELIYGTDKFLNETFKDIIEVHEKDGYKITNIKIGNKEEISLTDDLTGCFEEFIENKNGGIWCGKDYITDFCSFRKGKFYQILDKDEYAITLDDDNGKLVRFTYKLVNKCLFE